MSNIYIQEPPTSGKVLFITSVGDIDVELWARETPKACRNFVQLCMEGYYDNTIFHRLVPGFIVQGGDPTGTGEGGESIYGKTFKDEFHSRLRFNRRGLLGMANAGPHDNASQFFFTLGEATELNNKHTLFGKITGDTLYNMLKMADLETDGNERPVFPPKIIKTKVLNNPFFDIEPRDLPKHESTEKREKKKTSQSKATKDFKLLSFGEEAEEDDEVTSHMTSKMKGKSKSSHDLIDDPHLSKIPAVDESDLKHSQDHEMDRLKQKLKRTEKPTTDESQKEEPKKKEPSKLEKLREESEKLKKDLKQMRDSGKESKPSKHEQTKDSDDDNDDGESNEKPVDAIGEYKEDLAKYSHAKRSKQPRGSSREDQTLAMLKKFTKGLEHDDDDERPEKKPRMNTEEIEDEEDEYKDIEGKDWMNHKFVSQDLKKNKVMDANVYDAERYDIYDPRNPMNKRKLEASKEAMKQKKSRR